MWRLEKCPGVGHRAPPQLLLTWLLNPRAERNHRSGKGNKARSTGRSGEWIKGNPADLVAHGRSRPWLMADGAGGLGEPSGVGRKRIPELRGSRFGLICSRLYLGMIKHGGV